MDNRVYIDKASSNESFVKFCENHATINGIDTAPVLLRLIDRTLVGVNPYDETLDTDTKRKILNESIANPVYLIREILRDSSNQPFDMDIAKFFTLYLCLKGISVYHYVPKYHTQRDDFCRAIVKMGRVSSFGRQPYLVISDEDAIEVKAKYKLPELPMFEDIESRDVLFSVVRPHDVKSICRRCAEFDGVIIENADRIENLEDVVSELFDIVTIKSKMRSSTHVDFNLANSRFNLSKNCIIFGDRVPQVDSSVNKFITKLLKSDYKISNDTIYDCGNLDDYVRRCYGHMAIVTFDAFRVSKVINAIREIILDTIYECDEALITHDAQSEVKRKVFSRFVRQVLLLDYNRLSTIEFITCWEYFRHLYNEVVQEQDIKNAMLGYKK